MFKVFSMFDGVSGFIVGLEKANDKLGKRMFDVTHSNQYEPSRKSQDAYWVGVHNYPSISHSNADIMTVPDSYFEDMKEAGVNFIVGGFPCQDYSVARSKKDEKGLEGKKGVLFWEIIRAVKIIQPEYLILENVDRLLKSPSFQRGRDFGVMLAAFHQLGYGLEWRVVNSAEYGYPQKRKRVFCFIFKLSNTPFLPKKLEHLDFEAYIFNNSVLNTAFPISKGQFYKGRMSINTLSTESICNSDYVLNVSNHFKSDMFNTGLMINGKYLSLDAISETAPQTTLGDVISACKDYYVREYGQKAYEQYIESHTIRDLEKVDKFKYLRGSKRIERIAENGHKWIYSEGAMSETDELNLPARTMLTSEGSVNRSTHFIKTEDSYRTLLPIEAEILQGFPFDFTKFKAHPCGKVDLVSERMRMFFMGNALVTDVVADIAYTLGKKLQPTK